MKKRSLVSIFLAFVSMLIFAVVVNFTAIGYHIVTILLSEDQTLTVLKGTLLDHNTLSETLTLILNDSLTVTDKIHMIDGVTKTTTQVIEKEISL